MRLMLDILRFMLIVRQQYQSEILTDEMIKSPIWELNFAKACFQTNILFY